MADLLNELQDLIERVIVHRKKMIDLANRFAARTDISKEELFEITDVRMRLEDTVKLWEALLITSKTVPLSYRQMELSIMLVREALVDDTIERIRRLH